MLLQSLSCTRKGYKNKQSQNSINSTSSPRENISIIIYMFVTTQVVRFKPARHRPALRDLGEAVGSCGPWPRPVFLMLRLCCLSSRNITAIVI
jgi:hypothetical protein